MKMNSHFLEFIASKCFTFDSVLTKLTDKKVPEHVSIFHFVRSCFSGSNHYFEIVYHW